MVGTADDYIRFLEALRLGGAPVLSAASAAAFVADAVPRSTSICQGPAGGSASASAISANPQPQPRG